jgi:hypothetical protein
MKRVLLIGLIFLSVNIFAQEYESDTIILNKSVAEVINSNGYYAFRFCPGMKGSQSATDREVSDENKQNSRSPIIKITGAHLNLGLSTSYIDKNLAEREGIGGSALNLRGGLTLFLNKHYGIGIECEPADFEDKRKFEVTLISGETRESHVSGFFLSFFISGQLDYLLNRGIPTLPYIRFGYEGNWINRSPDARSNEIIINAPEEKIYIKEYGGFFLEPAIYFPIKDFWGISISYRLYLSDTDLFHKIMIDFSMLELDAFK